MKIPISIRSATTVALLTLSFAMDHAVAGAGDAARAERLWHDARIVIGKGGEVSENEAGVRMLNCTLYNPAGVPIGTYSTPENPFDLLTTITLATDGGTLTGSFRSILEDGVLPDGVFETLDDVDGKRYLVFEGTTLVGAPGDWVGTGLYQDVKKIIWRCKFEVDDAGNLVACLYCVYTFVY